MRFSALESALLKQDLPDSGGFSEWIGPGPPRRFASKPQGTSVDELRPVPGRSDLSRTFINYLPQYRPTRPLPFGYQNNSRGEHLSTTFHRAGN